jgi:hypothetical protein
MKKTFFGILAVATLVGSAMEASAQYYDPGYRRPPRLYVPAPEPRVRGLPMGYGEPYRARRFRGGNGCAHRNYVVRDGWCVRAW